MIERGLCDRMAADTRHDGIWFGSRVDGELVACNAAEALEAAEAINSAATLAGDT